MRVKSKKTITPYNDPFSPFVLMMMFSFFGFFGILFYLTYATLQGAAIMDILGVTLPEVYWSFLLFLTYLIFWIYGYSISFRANRRTRPPLLATGKCFSLPIGATFLIIFSGLFWIAYLFNPSIDDQFRSSLTTGAYGKFFFIVLTISLGYFGTFSVMMIQRYRASFFVTRGSTITILIWLIGFLILFHVLLSMGGRGRLISLIILLGAARHYLVRPITLFQFQILAVAAIGFAEVLPALLSSNATTHESLFEKLWGIEHGRTFDGLYNFTVITNWWWENGKWGFPGQLWVGDILGDLGFQGITNTRDVVMQSIYGRATYYAGFPATKPGEFLLNFGILGVPLGGLALGYMAGKIYTATIIRRAFGVASIPIYLTVSMRLGLMSPAGYFGQNIVFSTVAFLALLAIWAVFFGGYKLKRASI